MVNITPNTGADPFADMFKKLQGGDGIPAFSFSQETPPGSGIYTPIGVGTAYIGRLSEMPQFVQARDFTTKEPKFFDEAKTQPIEDLQMTFDTDLRDPANPDDDGRRRLYANHRQRAALKNALQLIGKQDFGVGTVMRWTHTGFGSNTKGGRAPYEFTCEILEWHPYVPAQQQQLQQGLGTQQVQPQQQVVGAQQYVNPQQPTFPGQVVPAPQQPGPNPYAQGQQQFASTGWQQPQASVQQPVAAPQGPQQAPLDTTALLAQVQAAQQAQAAQAAVPAVPAIAVTQEHVDAVKMLLDNGTEPYTAIAAVAMNVAPGNEEYRQLLESQILT